MAFEAFVVRHLFSQHVAFRAIRDPLQFRVRLGKVARGYLREPSAERKQQQEDQENAVFHF